MKKIVIVFSSSYKLDNIFSQLQMVEGNEKSTFSLAQFSAIAAFSERFLFSETQLVHNEVVSLLGS